MMGAALSGVHICSRYIIADSETQGSGKTDRLSAPTGRRIPAQGERPVERLPDITQGVLKERRIFLNDRAVANQP
jgi:hypothetical protein